VHGPPGRSWCRDLDDWFEGIPVGNRAYAKTHPFYNARENRNHYKASLMCSDLVICSTPFLKRKLEGKVRTIVIPNFIDMASWTPRTAYEGRKPVFGWVGSTSFHSGSLGVLRGVIGPFMEEHGLCFHHSGVGQSECRPDLVFGSVPNSSDELGISPLRMTISEPCNIHEYPKLFGPIEVGVVPLADNSFNQGKSWLKGLQFAAAGIPFAASPTESYKALAQHGIGRTCKRPSDWLRFFDMALDPDFRKMEADSNYSQLPCSTSPPTACGGRCCCPSSIPSPCLRQTRSVLPTRSP
jgi:hypothetical protein